VDRTKADQSARTGACGQGMSLRVAYVGPHFGEEPPITGTRGSGTVFFTGCPLGCAYCQNHQISRGGMGQTMGVDALVGRLESVVREAGVHNVNFVSPDHFFPYTFEVVDRLRGSGLRPPVVYNTSGYQAVHTLRMAEDHADIYLPDYKYSDPALAAGYSSCPDYPAVALGAIEEMLRQKGPLDTFETGEVVASRGVLVRHLILPGHVENSMDALTSLFVEFGADLPVSLMSQYCPVPGRLPSNLRRPILREEFDRVYDHFRDLGFRNAFVQFPEESAERTGAGFLPDFSKTSPFTGGPS